MKKSFFILIAAVLLLSGCSKNKNLNSSKISIVCTTFPIFDWTRNLASGIQDKVELSLIQKSGVDLHNFQPSAQDIISIRGSKLFIFVGGESDEWVEKVLLPENNVLNLFETDFPKLLEDDCGESEEESTEEEAEYDEHVWLSLKNAEVFCAAIAEKLCLLFPENQNEIKQSLLEYVEKLRKLDGEFSLAAVSAAELSGKTKIVLADRNPFAYFANDYSLEIFAAFKGCSAESEASFERIAYLVQAFDSISENRVFTLEDNAGDIAQTVISNSSKKNQASVKVQKLDAIQSVNLSQIESGVTYLDLFRKNMVIFQKN